MPEANKCIGIIGGMSAQSTVTYYQTIIDLHHAVTGNHSYPRIVIGSIPFQPVSDASHEGDWDGVRRLVQEEGDALISAGADFLLIATNTIHKVLPELVFAKPLLTIYDAVAVAAGERNYTRLGLTGTRFTMSDGFYEQELITRGLDVVIPSQQDQERIHHIIYDELVSGVVREESREIFSTIAGRLRKDGAEAVLLACTELELLTRDFQMSVPLLDTTLAHAEAAWKEATGRAEYSLYITSGTG